MENVKGLRQLRGVEILDTKITDIRLTCLSAAPPFASFSFLVMTSDKRYVGQSATPAAIDRSCSRKAADYGRQGWNRSHTCMICVHYLSEVVESQTRA